jgi:CRISPR/Cas system CSM-associated protein Csm3 (group 7 of RAMP superfamily)
MFLDYKITLETSMMLSPSSVFGKMVLIPGSTLKGMTRYNFQRLLNMGKEEEEKIFGNLEHVGKISFEDVIYDGERDTVTTAKLSASEAALEALDSYEVIPSGSELHGKVHIAPDITMRQINIVRYSIFLLGLTRIGQGKTRGYGKCIVEFPDIENAGMSFLSYAWEDENHNEWVLNLADNLVRSGISVIYDRYDLGFGDNFHVFMEDGIARAKKVLLIFTPQYKEKASLRHGGVGYEYSLINGELYDTLAQNKKFLPILRKGDVNSSIPPLYKQYLFCDMRDDNSFDKNFKDLYFTLLGKKQVMRPEIPWSKTNL